MLWLKRKHPFFSEISNLELKGDEIDVIVGRWD